MEGRLRLDQVENRALFEEFGDDRQFVASKMLSSSSDAARGTGTNRDGSSRRCRRTFLVTAGAHGWIANVQPERPDAERGIIDRIDGAMTTTFSTLEDA